MDIPLSSAQLSTSEYTGVVWQSSQLCTTVRCALMVDGRLSAKTRWICKPDAIWITNRRALTDMKQPDSASKGSAKQWGIAVAFSLLVLLLALDPVSTSVQNDIARSVSDAGPCSSSQISRLQTPAPPAVQKSLTTLTPR